MYNRNEGTSNDSDPSLLVLDNCIYTLGSHGIYHACVVKDKLNRNCAIEFADGTAKMLFENDLIWLSFPAMPKPLWPEQPIVLLAGNPVMVDGKMELAGQQQVDDGFVGPRSLKLVGSRTHLKRCVERCASLSGERADLVNDLTSAIPCSVPESRAEPR